MKFRHEYKHEITYSDLLTIRARLSAAALPDPYAKDGKYEIRSLYFDNLYDKALLEKINGVNCREKFRIRLYNGDSSLIKLEKKSKINGLCRKESVTLTPEEAQAFADGDIHRFGDDSRPLVCELYSKMKSQGLMPRTVVDYTREPFIFPAGNVRVTIDYGLRTGLNATELLDPHMPTVPAPNAPIILEVKWDEFLPSVIRDLVQLSGTRSAAFSKYAACRMYG